MRNRYGGLCYRCDTWVEPGDGHFEKRNGGWEVQHADCAIFYRGTVCGHARPRPTPEQMKNLT